jgi:predicted porin
MGASYAFSVIGYSGATAGMGNTENARLDDSVKYTYAHGPLRVGGLYQFSRRGGDNSNGGAAAQLDVGFDYNGFSADFLYGYKNGAISASPLSAAQLATPGVKRDSLAASVSDTTAWAANGSWTNGPWKLSGGYEHIEFENPEHPLVPGFSGLGGYEFSFVNNTAYSAHHRVLQVSWFGAKYQISKELSITGAYYHYDQNSYGAVRCSNTSAGTCEGTLDAYSVMGDYRFTKRFDIYAGVMYSTVHDGLASGYLHDNSADPMVGFRYSF